MQPVPETYVWSSDPIKAWFAEPTGQWVANSESAVCMVDGRPFGYFGLIGEARHHCRKCGKLICGACSVFPTALPVEKAITGCPERACIPCAKLYLETHPTVEGETPVWVIPTPTPAPVEETPAAVETPAVEPPISEAAAAAIPAVI